MEFITKRLINLSTDEIEILKKADGIINQIISKMKNDGINNKGRQVTLHMFSSYGEECSATYSDMKILDNQLFTLAYADELITSFDEGDEDGQ